MIRAAMRIEGATFPERRQSSGAMKMQAGILL
jgi:hypothetical protein